VPISKFCTKFVTMQKMLSGCFAFSGESTITLRQNRSTGTDLFVESRTTISLPNVGRHEFHPLPECFA
jgi:hypothetical protein